MITEEKCHCGSCDNCGETYADEHSGFSLFVDASSCTEHMDNDGWYSGGDDAAHEGKNYCPDCFKYDDEIDDLIHLNVSRKKLNSEQNVQVSDTTDDDSSTEAGQTKSNPEG